MKTRLNREIHPMEIPWRVVGVLVVLALLALLGGCATIERHPRLVAAGVVVVGTSLALSLHGHSTIEPEFKKSIPLTCSLPECKQ